MSATGRGLASGLSPCSLPRPDQPNTGTGRRPVPAAGAVVVRVDGRAVEVAPGTTVAAAIELAAPGRGARRSPGGARRLPFCGMGVCGECRVTVDGRAHRLGCQTVCAPGMEIATDA